MAAAGVGPAVAVRLDFVVSPSRRADLDNLVRPAIEGLQDAGVFARAYAGLDAILATRSVASPAHLRVGLRGEDVTEAPIPGPVLAVAQSQALPREGNVASKRAWRDLVAVASDPLPAGPVWLDIAVSAPWSLKDLLKPIIDGLEPWLGRDPHGRLEFCPMDQRVVWLRITRVRGVGLGIKAGLIAAATAT